MMSGIGEIFLSAFLPVLLQQVIPRAISALTTHKKVKEGFKKLSKFLNEINGYLEDAEEQQYTEISVKLWLKDLRDVIYDLDDIVDEIKAQTLIMQSHEKRHQKRYLISKLMCSCSDYTLKAIVFNNKMVPKIDGITSRVQEIARRRVELNLSVKNGALGNRRRLAKVSRPNLLQEDHVFGREKEKEQIIGMLCERYINKNDFLVVSIVGMSGIGKTTLAKAIYYDPIIEESFHVKALAYVSQDFDIFTVTRKIYEDITNKKADSEDMDTLQKNLLQELSNKRFLIVLDDVWNRNYIDWMNLISPLRGHPGSRIVVTTRDEEIANMASSNLVTPYYLKLLSDKNCLLVMLLHAGISLDEKPELANIGNQLVKRCKGLPLAAKILGGVLRSKEAMVEKWEKVLQNKIWDLDEEYILPVLRLSYFDLSPHLKRLFAYCAIFPKDYKFQKDQLVLLWMAEGFLDQHNESEGKSKEEWGVECFDELLSKSFFQYSSKRDSIFVMHDLIIDFALFVSKGICYHLDNELSQKDIPEKIRHCSFIRQQYETFDKFNDFVSRTKGIRTLVSMPIGPTPSLHPYSFISSKILHYLPDLLCLRVLSLCGYHITELPSSVCELVHLRYLNISQTYIVELPDSLGDLILLETLIISGCDHIKRLPRSLGSLSNLRHLENSNTDELNDVPIEIGKLKHLRTFSKVCFSKNGGFGLNELHNLKLLHGKLTLFNLQNVTEIVEACLSSKKSLHNLELVWMRTQETNEYIEEKDVPASFERDVPASFLAVRAMDRILNEGIFHCSPEEETIDEIKEKGVLECLQPHENLRVLKIIGFGGSEFSRWIVHQMYTKLSSVTLVDCLKCIHLPALGHLPNLVNLAISGMDEIRSIGQEFYGNFTPIPFPKLETLSITKMPNLTKFEKYTSFPNLQELEFSHCERLDNVSKLVIPSLLRLKLDTCSGILLQSFHGLNSLTIFEASRISGLLYLPIQLVDSFSSLETLHIEHCNDLLYLWHEDITIHSLRSLSITSCPLFHSLGNGSLQIPCNIEDLILNSCPYFVSLPNELTRLGSIRELRIIDCEGFASFPDNQIPPNLRILCIERCKALQSLPSNISGVERLEIVSMNSSQILELSNTLKTLEIRNCFNLDLVPDTRTSLENFTLIGSLKNWKSIFNHFSTFDHIVDLNLYRCGTIEHICIIPRSLVSLSIYECESLKSLPREISSMTKCTTFQMEECYNLDEFPCFNFPPNLSHLTVWNCRVLKPLMDWNLVSLYKLKEFHICGGFQGLEQLNEKGYIFPGCLNKLHVAVLPNLISLGNALDNVVSLRFLTISKCDNFNILPNVRILKNLWSIEIQSRSDFKGRVDYLRKNIGIPRVEIHEAGRYQLTWPDFGHES